MTIARHRRLFRPWLRFAATLMPGGVLPRADSELVILRVAHNAELCSQKNLVPAALERAAQQLLVLVRPVCVRRIKKVDTEVQRAINGGK